MGSYIRFLGRKSTKINLHLVEMDVSKDRGTPKWMVYNGKPYFLMDDLGVPLFSETSKSVHGNFPTFHTSLSPVQENHEHSTSKSSGFQWVFFIGHILKRPLPGYEHLAASNQNTNDRTKLEVFQQKTRLQSSSNLK